MVGARPGDAIADTSLWLWHQSSEDILAGSTCTSASWLCFRQRAERRRQRPPRDCASRRPIPRRGGKDAVDWQAYRRHALAARVGQGAAVLHRRRAHSVEHLAMAWARARWLEELICALLGAQRHARGLLLAVPKQRTGRAVDGLHGRGGGPLGPADGRLLVEEGSVQRAKEVLEALETALRALVSARALIEATSHLKL